MDVLRTTVGHGACESSEFADAVGGSWRGHDRFVELTDRLVDLVTASAVTELDGRYQARVF